jgi:hypothetical protein
LREAAQGVNFQDEVLKNLTERRFDLLRLFVRINSDFPQIQLHEWCKQNEPELATKNLLDWVLRGLTPENIAPNQIHLLKIPKIINKLTKYYNELKAKQHYALSAVKLVYTEKEKQDILDKLIQLTGRQEWKVYQKNGLQFLLQIPAEMKAMELAKALMRTNAMSARRMMVTTTKQPAVLVGNVHSERLAKVNTLDGWTNEAKANDEQNVMTR